MKKKRKKIKSIEDKTIEEQVRDRWKLLNSFGVYTEEDVKEFVKKYQLDVGIFTLPLEELKGE